MNAETPSTQGNYLASLVASAANQTHIDLVGMQSHGLVHLGQSDSSVGINTKRGLEPLFT